MSEAFPSNWVPIEFQYPNSDEVEIVTFKPENDTLFDQSEKFGREQIIIDGKRLAIHNTNNFRLHFAVYTQPPVDSPTLKQSLEMNRDLIYRDKMDLFEQIMPQVQQRYPRLYQKITDIVTAEYQKRDEREKTGLPKNGPVDLGYSEQEQDFVSYYFSMAYDAAATAARQLDPKTDLSLIFA